MKLPPFPKPSWLSRLGLALTSVAAVVVSFVAASLLFAILLTVGLVFAAWLWWQLRRLVRQAQKVAPEVIEGEYTLVPARPALEDQNAPHRDLLSDPPPPRRATTRKNRRASRSHR
jgi:hypothetical protein